MSDTLTGALLIEGSGKKKDRREEDRERVMHYILKKYGITLTEKDLNKMLP